MKKITLLIITLLTLIGNFNCAAQNKSKGNAKEFTASLMQDSCVFITTGRNPYFILEPGYQLVLEGIERNDTTHLVITVLNETKKIGGVETRIVEENESVNGKTAEISRNFFAFCKQTSSIYYFGEEVDIYKNGKVVSHDGAWTAEGKNKAGVALPGLILLGSRYYQEIAPGIAMDRAEVISINEILETPAGKFANVLRTEETTLLEPKDISYKLYARGIGLIQDDNLILKKYGFIK
jgi:hypothetical protein